MKAYLYLSALLIFIACSDDEPGPNLMPIPENYEFARGGESTVNYDGQNDRLDQLEEIKSKILNEANRGGIVDQQVLIDAFDNANGDGNGFFTFTSTKQLKSKAFQPDLDDRLFENLFADISEASQAGSQGIVASDGQAGLLTRENSGNTILVDGRGREMAQLIEKGIMGSVFYNQIYNVYLTDERTGDNVENELPREGQPYTDMEHHWDEAFGYWNPPHDFTSPWPSDRLGETRFWSRYSNTVDNVAAGLLGTNHDIMTAFLTGRTAIVNKDYTVKNESRNTLYEKLDLVAAAVTVHYINSTLAHLSQGNTGEAFHTLSEAWAFANALRYNPQRRLGLEQIETIKNSDFGSDGNFWRVTSAGLNKAKQTIIDKYAELEAVRDVL